MVLFFLGVLAKLRLDTFAGQARGHDGVLGITQDAHQLGGQHRLQNLDRGLDVAAIGSGDGAGLQVLAGPVAQRDHIGEKRLVLFGERGHGEISW